MRRVAIRTQIMLLCLGVIVTALVAFSLVSYGALHYALFQLKIETLRARKNRLVNYVRQSELRNPDRSLEAVLQDYGTIAHEGNLIQLQDESGAILFPEVVEVRSQELGNGACKGSLIQRADFGGQRGVILCDHIVLKNRSVVLSIGGSLEDMHRLLELYRRTLFGLFPILLVIAAMGGRFLSRRVLLPVNRMTKAAVDIGIGNLSARLPVPEAKDELHALATAWNQLLERLQAAIFRLSEFSADASHDLRTSITVILATAQLSLRVPRSQEEYQKHLESITHECETATTLLDALLSLARSETFMHEAHFKRINLVPLTLEACHRVEYLADVNGVLLDWNVPDCELWVVGDEVLLQRLLGILLDNAIKYTPESGQILVELNGSDESVEMSVRDTGIGISAEAQEQIFERYYQSDLRDRKSQGSGLGLSIARWIAEAHRAELNVESELLHGSHFRIAFPSIRTIAENGRLTTATQ